MKYSTRFHDALLIRHQAKTPSQPDIHIFSQKENIAFLPVIILVFQPKIQYSHSTLMILR